MVVHTEVACQASNQNLKLTCLQYKSNYPTIVDIPIVQHQAKYINQRVEAPVIYSAGIDVLQKISEEMLFKWCLDLEMWCIFNIGTFIL